MNSNVANNTVGHRDRVTATLTEKEIHWREVEARSELDDGDAKRLVETIRAQL